LLRANHRAAVACTLLVLGGCSGGPGAVSDRPPADEVVVFESVLATIMRERGVPRERALELGVEDALLARELRARQPELGRWLERVVLARQTLGALLEDAKAGGPPTDAEVQELSAARFWEFDRPRMVQVAHAVVVSRDENPAARALAERIGKATAGIADVEKFKAAAEAVPAESFTVKVEMLTPVTADGRAVEPKQPPPAGPPVQHLDPLFSTAAAQLEHPGDQSGVVRSQFGYHVILLLSVIPPQQPSLDERRALLHDEIMRQRASALSETTLERQRRELVPQQERSALAAMQVLGAGR